MSAVGPEGIARKLVKNGKEIGFQLAKSLTYRCANNRAKVQTRFVLQKTVASYQGKSAATHIRVDVYRRKMVRHCRSISWSMGEGKNESAMQNGKSSNGFAIEYK